MKSFILCIGAILLLSGCGSSSDSTSQTAVTNAGMFVDGPVQGLTYNSKSHNGSTLTRGFFYFRSGEEVTFKVGEITLGKRVITTTDSLITPISLVTAGTIDDHRVVEMLRILQTLDTDKTDTIITLPAVVTTSTIDLSQAHEPLSDSQLADLIDKNTAEIVSAETATSHFNDTLTNIAEYENEILTHTNNQSQDDSDGDDSDSDSDSDDSDNTTDTVG